MKRRDEKSKSEKELIEEIRAAEMADRHELFFSVRKAVDKRFAASADVSVSSSDPFVPSLGNWKRAALRSVLVNGLAKAIVETNTDFVVGDGWIFETDSSELRDVIAEHWYDEVNDWDADLGERVDGLHIFGEMAFELVVPEEGEGYVLRVAEIDPLKILDYRVDKRFPQALRYVLVSDRSGIPKWLKIPRRVPGGRYDLTFDPSETIGGFPVAGLAAYLSTGRFPGRPIGRPDLLPILDPARMIDELVHVTMERARWQNMLLYHVSVDGADEKEVEELQEKLQPPSAPGETWVTSDAVKVSPLTPDLRGGDVKDLRDLALNIVLAGGRSSRAWIGEGEQVNRASAAEMSVPIYRRILRRQRRVVAFVEKIVEIQIQVAVERGVLPEASSESEWRIVPPPIIPDDLQSSMNTFSSMIDALSVGTTSGIVPFAEAREMYRRIGIRLNFPIPEESPAESAPNVETAESEDGRDRFLETMLDEILSKNSAGLGRRPVN